MCSWCGHSIDIHGTVHDAEVSVGCTEGWRDGKGCGCLWTRAEIREGRDAR